jgi:nitroreductase
MNPVSTQQLLEALNWRYATKAFDPARKLPADTWSALEQTLVLSPSSFGLQPYQFLVVQDPALRQQLLPHTWNQEQVVDCSHYIVFTVRTSLATADIDGFIQLISSTRNTPPGALAGYRGMMVGALVDGPLKSMISEWASRQAYIALGNLLTSAALLGIDTCPIEGFSPTDYNRILNLPPTGYTSSVCCALGYRAATDKHATLPKVRYPVSQLVRHIG